MSYTIEYDVPLPENGRTLPDPNSAAGVLRMLEVGQSVLIHDRTVVYIRGVIARLSPKKFSAFVKSNGVRVWRRE